MDRREEALTRPLFATVAYAEAFGFGTIDLPEWQTRSSLDRFPGRSRSMPSAVIRHGFRAGARSTSRAGAITRARGW